MLKVITTWNEKYKNEGGDNLLRQRAFKYDTDTQEIVDFSDHQETMRTPIDTYRNMEISNMKTHEARVLVKFCKEQK